MCTPWCWGLELSSHDVSICPLKTGTLSVSGASSYTWNGSSPGSVFTDNPLMRFKVVQEAANEYEGNSANGLRAILKRAIEQVRRWHVDWKCACATARVGEPGLTPRRSGWGSSAGRY